MTAALPAGSDKTIKTAPDWVLFCVVLDVFDYS